MAKAEKTNSLPKDYVRLQGSERPPIPGSTLTGPIDGSDRVSVTLLLRRRPGSPSLPGLEHWQNTPPDKRKFLSAEEYMRQYGSSEEDMNAVIGFCRSRELDVLESDAGRHRIVIEATVEALNAAFAVTLNWYRAPDRVMRLHSRGPKDHPGKDHVHIREHVHRGFEGPAHLPAGIAGIVTAVVGLDNRRLGGPAGNGTGDPAGAEYLSPITIAELYSFPTSNATGQTIGLFEGADAGAAYLATDIDQFLQNLPGVGSTILHPILKDIGLLGNINDPSNITNPFDFGAVFECTLDVSVAAAAAPGANINVYFTDDNEAGWEAFFQRAILPLPGDNPPSVLSASWVPYLSDDSGTIGSLSSSGSPVSIMTGFLQLAAARGITVLMAIGDWGANNLLNYYNFPDTRCHVSYPNADPWVTSCGGTIIGNISGSSPATFEELTWSDANLASPFNSGPPQPIYDATGGGVSDTFPVPPYQVAAGILPISKNDGNARRGVPDVAGMVAMDGLFINGTGGYAGYGTSAVAPLYAGLTATVNAFLGHNVGFLNPTLYKYGPEICNDILVGNNDSGNAPDSPFYTTGVGWDPCTGWGSIRGLRLLAALAPAPIIVTAIADTGDFGNTCAGSFVDKILTINNSGFSMLLVSGISSSSVEFETPSVVSYPLMVSPGSSIDVMIRFKPVAAGTFVATLTIQSNDLFSPRKIIVKGASPAPRLALAIAGTGNFGNTCIGSFTDQPLILSNSGKCTLEISDCLSSSVDFLVPAVLSYPLSIEPGNALPIPIRFQPVSLGFKTATITVISNDPAGPKSVLISGSVPTGKLAVTGSTHFGGVKACCRAERTISICNTGDCKLQIWDVAFKRKSPYWKLVNNPFPATLHPGSCLAVVIRYKAAEKCPRCCELVITSDDPVTPVKVLDVMAYTIWSDCGCGDGRKAHTEKCHGGPCNCSPCCDDCDEEGDPADEA